jgi:hypothetical protein
MGSGRGIGFLLHQLLSSLGMAFCLPSFLTIYKVKFRYIGIGGVKSGPVARECQGRWPSLTTMTAFSALRGQRPLVDWLPPLFLALWRE